MNYSSLTERILSNTHLANTIQLLEDKDTLNLISADWKERLQNNIIFQNYLINKNLWKVSSTSVTYNYEESKVNFNVLIVGECRFAKALTAKGSIRPAVFVVNSEPLLEIAKAMTHDIGTNIQFSNESKFNFNSCSVLSCDDCSTINAIFTKHGYKLCRTTQPCIMDTKVFDGKSTVNRFQSQMEDMFPQSFLAILNLNINVRYHYWDSEKQKIHRIGGKVTEIIAFNEAKLNASKSINLGELTTIDENKCEKVMEKEDSTDDIMPSEFEFVTTTEQRGNKKRKREDIHDDTLVIYEEEEEDLLNALR